MGYSYLSLSEPKPSEPVRAKNEDETRKEMLSEVTRSHFKYYMTNILQKAETLRTRLQLALFKVQTNQTSKPFSRLNAPRSRSPELPPLPQSSSPLSSPPDRGCFMPMSPESKIAIARARATMQTKPSVKALDTIGHPTILPTAFSARNFEPETR